MVTMTCESCVVGDMQDRPLLVVPLLLCMLLPITLKLRLSLHLSSIRVYTKFFNSTYRLIKSPLKWCHGWLTNSLAAAGPIGTPNYLETTLHNYKMCNVLHGPVFYYRMGNSGWITALAPLSKPGLSLCVCYNNIVLAVISTSYLKVQVISESYLRILVIDNVYRISV